MGNEQRAVKSLESTSNAPVTFQKPEIPLPSAPDFPSTSRTTDPSIHVSEILVQIPSNCVTPRKRKLMNQLDQALKISNERKRKVDTLRKKIVRKDKKIANLEAIITELQSQNYVQDEALEVLSKLGGPNELFLRQYKKSLKKSLPSSYSEELRVFALTLHFYSPAAYNYVRRTFNTCLPHTRTLSRWYQSINGEPGFTSEAFNALRLKASAENHAILCSLIMDEMSIRQQGEWVSSQDRCYGYVDMGTGAKDNTLAKEALVFLLNCINGNWKIPVGYFLIAGCTAEQKKNLVLQCLARCHEVGIQVVSLTFDGAPANLSMARHLGCDLKHKNLKTSFKHPTTNEEVVVFLDPCHMLKLARNILGEKGSLVDDEDRLVEWRYFKDLHKLQYKENFHLANKVRSQHINFFRQKMKVRLASQIFSESVATALMFCKSELHMPEFADVDATVKFTQTMNNLFDILNSRNLMQFSYKQPLSAQNFEKVDSFLNTADKYISGLKTNVGGTFLLDTTVHTGFLGLKVCISSLKLLYQKLIGNDILQFLPVYKCSQDHVELFFSSIRSHGGYNNNPTARQFQAAYKKLLVHVEIRETFRGNCIPLEQFKILRCNDTTLQINLTSKEHRIMDQETELVDVNIDHDYLPQPDPMSPYSKFIIAYIGGYVVYYLLKRILCEDCKLSLVSKTKDSFLFSFIDMKNKNGLQYPSEDVLEICFRAEKMIKREVIQIQTGSNLSACKLTSLVLKELMGRNIFPELLSHGLDQFALDNHRILLIKSVAERYINIRLYYINKNKVDKSSSVRHFSNKIVLFKGQ